MISASQSHSFCLDFCGAESILPDILGNSGQNGRLDAFQHPESVTSERRSARYAGVQRGQRRINPFVRVNFVLLPQLSSKP
jgi:hypothetical protein